MIFLTWEQVLGLKLPAKGQTRRPVKEGDYTWFVPGYDCIVITEVCTATHRVKWAVGTTYAVQPGRSKAAVWWRPDGTATATPLYEYLQKNESSTRALWGPKVKAWLREHGYREARIEIKQIRRETLQEISEEDCIAEGAPPSVGYELDYIPGWQSLGDGRHFTDEQRLSGYKGAFASMWDEIYPRADNWLENPEVWVLDFEMEVIDV